MSVINIVEVEEKVFMFVAKRPSCHVYLIRADAKNVLIDTGIDTNYPELEWALAKVGLTRDDIHIIVNTHEHFDHVGANACFSDKSVILASTSAASKIREQDEYVTMLNGYNIDGQQARPHIWLTGNTALELGDFFLKIYETPGHTSGCICIYKPVRKLLFSGDMVFADGTLSLIAPSGSAGDYMASLERLSNLKIATLLPGHGKLSTQPETDLMQALETAKAKLQGAYLAGGTDIWTESRPVSTEKWSA